MKTTGISDEVLPLTKRQKCACNIVTGVLLIVAGFILALAGGNVIKVSVSLIAAPTIVFAVGLSVLLGAAIAKNSISMWIGGVIIACGIPSLINAAWDVSYSVTYPLYIAAPALGCALAAIFAEIKSASLKAAAFFAVLAVLFALASGGAIGYGLAGGLVAAFAGVCVIAIAVAAYFKKDVDKNA